MYNVWIVFVFNIGKDKVKRNCSADFIVRLITAYIGIFANISKPGFTRLTIDGVLTFAH